MALVPVGDAMYLWGESSGTPSHVIGLQIFRPPAGAGPELLDELYASMTDPSTVKPAFRRRPYRSPATAGQYAWAIDEDLDLTLHVRRVGLPRPGRIRELLEHVADWHAVRLNRDRPLWEAHLVEGLEDGRFALCTKMHHSQFDGVNMGRHLLGGLSPDPADRNGTAPWVITRRRHRRSGAEAAPETVPEPTPEDRGDWLSSLGKQVADLTSQVGSQISDVASAIGGTVQALAGNGLSSARAGELTLPFTAPKTMFNGSVGSARRFAGDDWPIDRLRKVARQTDTSINDVALTMCAGALRAYLIEQNALPSESLVAMVPVSLTPTDPAAAAREGNSWAAVLCNLGTDCADPLVRLRRIHTSMRRSKNLMSELDTVTATAISASTLGGVVLNSIPGVPMPPRPPFNLVISNVPAVNKRLYLDGCELTDAYPVSVVTDGQALNMTLVSYADSLAFGITGCRKSVPHLQRLLPHLEETLSVLEQQAIAADY
jgi:WS/DGAT/MGAT family acyltransferase